MTTPSRASSTRRDNSPESALREMLDDIDYVGITRAQKTLTMTLAGKRKMFGENQDTTPSRFLEELPEEDCIFEGFGKAAPEQNQAKGAETLGSLLSMFD
ncbi:hypothetical protein JF535_00955 [Microbulbifer salipaludis]|uniref:Uncharacterized protein n=1 Tax=Microbulbifer salipaludis TaxID=187980 RepID=A0ABS3E2A6_9GAMM|nr:hypothetical protein [Microbulbifer salipaludis]